MKNIEVVVNKYFAGPGYDGYSAKLPDTGIINFRMSKSVIGDHKPKQTRIALEWDDAEGGGQ